MIDNLRERLLIPLIISHTIFLGIFIYYDIRLLRIIFGLPFMLFLPGFLIIKVLSIDGLKFIGKLGLSIGLSILVISIIGLGLNFSPWGLHELSLYLCLATFVFVLSLIAYWDMNFIINLFSIDVFVNKWKGITTVQKITISISLLSVLSIVSLLIFRIATIKPGEKFTEFYILDESNKLESSLMVIANPYEEINIKIGIVNHEQELMTYHVEISISGMLIYKSENISLLIDEAYETLVAITPPNSIRDGEKISIILYKGNDLDPYVILSSWVKIK